MRLGALGTAVVGGYHRGGQAAAGAQGLSGAYACLLGVVAHPDPEVGPKHAGDLRRAITIAGLLGVKRIVAMSGLPAAHEGGRFPSWVVNPWDSQYLDVLDYQWQEVAIPFWKDIEARAREADVKVCIEMHRLATEINATHVGAEMDPSHLFWQGIDPVAAIGDLVYHAAAKDTASMRGTAASTGSLMTASTGYLPMRTRSASAGGTR